MGEHTAYKIVPITEATRDAFLELDHTAWFDEPDPTHDETGGLDLSRSFSATRTGEPPFSGNYSHYDLRVTVPAPGGALQQVPCAGLTWVGVHPDARRTGVLSTMLTHHFEDIHEQGIPLAGLHASETGIYGRFGYAHASDDVGLKLGKGDDLTAPGIDTDGVRTEMVRATADGVADRALAVHRASAAQQLGQVTLPEQTFRHRFHDSPEALRGSEPLRVVFAVRDGVDIGYAMLRRTHKWEAERPQGKLECLELVGADPVARLVLARRLVNFDLMGSIEVWVDSLDDEVIWWLGGPRAAGVRVRDSLWLRIVDVGAALSLRGYAADVDVVLDVADDRCAWNARAWRLTARDGVGKCVPTDDPADVAVTVQALGSAYLGGRSVASMARQGIVTEHTDGAVEALTRAFATTTLPASSLGF